MCHVKYSMFLILSVVIIFTSVSSLNRHKRQFAWEDFDDNGAQVSTSTSRSGPTVPIANFNRCMSNCPRTPQYNPVCGNDGNTYHNNHTLSCTNSCGRSVQYVRSGTCSAL